jgi:hypothetical protein
MNVLDHSSSGPADARHSGSSRRFRSSCLICSGRFSGCLLLMPLRKCQITCRNICSKAGQHAITSACRMYILQCCRWGFGAFLEAPHRGKRAPCGKHRLSPATNHRCRCRPPPCQPLKFVPPASDWQLVAYMGILSRCGWRQLSKYKLQQQPYQDSSPVASRRRWSSSGSRSLTGGCPLGACCLVVPHPLDLFGCQARPSADS